MRESRLGRVLAERWRLDRVLGEGGMGTVYEAADLRGGAAVAVKVLALEAATTKGATDALRREAEAAGAAGSPHIRRVLDFGVDGPAPFLVMELLDGEDLGARLARAGRLSLRQTAALLDQIADALEAAHAAGVVHLDLKPANLFLAREGGRDDRGRVVLPRENPQGMHPQEISGGIVKVLDFGIARVLQEPSLALRTGSLIGTPNYMSPELAMGRLAEIDRRSDVFALGAIAYECVSGRMAFDAKSLAGALVQVCDPRPPPLRGLPPEVAAPLERVLARAMAKARDDRFPTVTAFRDAFRAVSDAAGEDVIADPSAVSGVSLRPPTLSGSEVAAPAGGATRRWWILGAVAAVLVAAALLLAR